MTSKQRAYLKSIAMTTEASCQIGKAGLTEEIIAQADEALAARELVKISVLKTCPDDARAMGEAIAEATASAVVQVIGRKIVLYREGKDDKKKIVLPPAKKSEG